MRALLQRDSQCANEYIYFYNLQKFYKLSIANVSACFQAIIGAIH